jgi:hypothetical protein
MPSPSTSALKVYEEIYNGDPGNLQALHELFPPDGDVGAQASPPPLGGPSIGL